MKRRGNSLKLIQETGSWIAWIQLPTLTQTLCIDSGKSLSLTLASLFLSSARPSSFSKPSDFMRICTEKLCCWRNAKRHDRLQVTSKLAKARQQHDFTESKVLLPAKTTSASKLEWPLLWLVKYILIMRGMPSKAILAIIYEAYWFRYIRDWDMLTMRYTSNSE